MQKINYQCKETSLSFKSDLYTFNKIKHATLNSNKKQIDKLDSYLNSFYTLIVFQTLSYLVLKITIHRTFFLHKKSLFKKKNRIIFKNRVKNDSL